MVTRVPLAGPAETVRTVLQRLGGGQVDAAEAVYVVDPAARLLGLVRLCDLLAADPERSLGEIMLREPPAVLPTDDQEHAANVAVHHDLSAVPVVGTAGEFLGAVPARALIRILRSEHVEDLHRLAGMRRETELARRALEAPPLRRAQDRLPWLLLGLAGSGVATAVMARFEGVLHRQVEVAFFVPGLVYLADAVGTQTEAVAVRGLSLSRATLGHLVASELRAGLLVGLLMACSVLPLVWLGFGSFGLAAAVALSALAASGVAAVVGLMLPWGLARAGRDPAFGSGPLATIVQDVLTLLIYFTVVRVLF